MIAAVADDLHHAALRLRQPQPQRHAAAEAEPAAGKADIALRFCPRDVLLQNRPVADGFVDDDVVLRELCAQRREYKGRTERAGHAFVGARRGTPLRGCFARPAPACNARGNALAIGIVRARFDGIEHLLQHDRAIALDAHVGGKAPHRKIRFQGIDVDLDPFDRARTAWRIAERTARRNRAAARDRLVQARAGDRCRRNTANPAGY